MMRTLKCWLFPFLLTLVCCLTPLHAQQPQVEKVERGVSGEALPGEKGDPVPAPQYALAGIATIILLVVLCKPSRKVYQE